MLVIHQVCGGWSYSDETWIRNHVRAELPGLGPVGAIRAFATNPSTLETIEIPPYTRWDLTTTTARLLDAPTSLGE